MNTTARSYRRPLLEGREPPRDQAEATRQAASESGLAHESDPGSTTLAGTRHEVLDAMRTVIAA